MPAVDSGAEGRERSLEPLAGRSESRVFFVSEAGYVVEASAVEPSSSPGDTAETRVTFGPDRGSQRLEQRVIAFRPGRSRPRSPGGRQEVLYVVSGEGSLGLAAGQEYRLQPDTAVLVAPGQAYSVETGTGLEVVSVLCPSQRATRGPCLVSRFADRPEEQADDYRSFRVLIETSVTAFVGLVKPSRAPDHAHPYDEVGYILEGQGIAHVGGRSTPIGPGFCFHLPPEEVHCIENLGPGLMRILGVFYPSGSPASRVYEQSV
ncbi:MAG: hypothetical protein C4306_11840 [Thermoleophilia bacterium]